MVKGRSGRPCEQSSFFSKVVLRVSITPGTVQRPVSILNSHYSFAREAERWVKSANREGNDAEVNNVHPVQKTIFISEKESRRKPGRWSTHPSSPSFSTYPTCLSPSFYLPNCRAWFTRILDLKCHRCWKIVSYRFSRFMAGFRRQYWNNEDVGRNSGIT